MAEHFTGLAAEIVAELDYEFETNLIEAVKYHRCLYAMDHPDYENTQQNKISWLKISSGLGRSVAECVNKWYALLQIFFNYFKIESNDSVTHPPIAWAHYKAIKEMQPYLAENYSELIQSKPPFVYGKPTKAQREALVHELETHRIELMGVHATMEQRQQVWSQIVDKLNLMLPGAKMPVIKWQKYWWDMKQAVGVQRSWIQTKLKSMGTRIEVSKFSEEDVKILKFCGAAPTDTPASINAHLSRNVEFGSDTNQIVRRCKKCTLVLNELMVNDYCDTCRKIPKTLCDICSKRHEDQLNVYQLKNWSTHAKNLLPLSFYSFAELSVCTVCSNNLKKQASLVWFACRICESYSQGVENLFSPSTEHLRNVFKKATNIEFTEGDGLPGYICKVCKVQMQQFNNFYLRFSRAQMRLREIHVNNFVGVATGRPHCKKKLDNSIIPSNQVMILRPEGDTSNCELARLQQNYTLHPRTEPEIPTTTNIAATKTTQSICTQPSVSITRSVYSKAPVIKRICTCQAGGERGDSLPTSTGTVVARRIGTVPNMSAKLSITAQPGATLVGKGICALHPESKSVLPFNSNIGSKVEKLICRPMISTAKVNFRAQTESTSSNPISGATQGIRAVQPISSSGVTMPTNVGLAIGKRTSATTVTRTIQPGSVLVAPTLTHTGAIATKGIGVLPQVPTSGAIRNVVTKGFLPIPPGPVPVPVNTMMTKGTLTASTTSATNGNAQFLPRPAQVPINTIVVSKGNSAPSPVSVLASPLSANSGTTSGKRIKTSQPAVFTISGMDLDYEAHLDSPPVFCIPRSGPHLKATSNSTPTNTTISTLIETRIKTEKMNKGYPGEETQTASITCPVPPNRNYATPSSESKADSEVSSNASTLSVESPNLSSAHQDISSKRMKLVRPDGSTVVYKPTSSATHNSTTNVQSSSTSFQNAFASTKFHLIQPRKVTNGRLTPSTNTKVYPGRETQACPIPAEEQQRQQQLQPASGFKRMRKYWGAVDEFQITPVTAKINSNSAVPLKRRRMTIHSLSLASPASPADSPVSTSNSPTNTSLPPGEIVDADVVIKKEVDQPLMFYPDSFELGNVCLDADVSSMISKMMTKQEEIEDNIKSFEYINPSFLVSYAQDQNLSKKVNESKEEPQKVEHKEKKRMKEDKHQENTTENVKSYIRIPTKNVRVKIKRNIGIRKLSSRLKITSPPPTKLIITRKSLRRNNVMTHNTRKSNT